jgi:magnesium-transporting ATPase (P-type)
MANWHGMERKEVLSSLGSALEGLTQTEAKARLEKYGPNELMEKEKISALKIFIDQFKNFLIIIFACRQRSSLLYRRMARCDRYFRYCHCLCRPRIVSGV